MRVLIVALIFLASVYLLTVTKVRLSGFGFRIGPNN